MRRLLIASLLGGACATAHGQALPPLPDSGALQRSQQQQQEFLTTPVQPPQPVRPVISDEQAPQDNGLSPASTVRFTLENLIFTPSHYLSDADLQAIARKYVRQQVTYDDLQEILSEVNALYRQHRIFTARAILPPQRVANGIVHIELVEGNLGESSIQGNEATRASWINGWLEMPPGQPLDTGELERRIELFNHVNTVQLDARLRPGQSFGVTDLAIQATEPQRYQLQLFADNMGAPSVGGNEVGMSGAIDNPLGIGDLLGLYYVHSHGSDSGALNYSLPVNRSGGRLGLSLGSLSSHVTSGPYQDFDVNGRSRSARLQFSQPVARLGAWWLDGMASGGITRSSNDILGIDLGNNTVRTASVGLTALGLYDTRSFSLALTHSYHSICSDTESSRHAQTWNLNGSWTQKITNSDYSVVRVGAQKTNSGQLNSSLAMQIGGAATVRGYTLGAIAGDDGYWANLEWHHRLFNRVTGYAFADAGGVHTPDIPSQQVASVGLGLDVSLLKDVQLNVVAARTLKTVTADQDRWQVTARLSWQVF
ncbi:ShlB/FhaC/HecB family hemolysin secretion/activation protein [Paraburkholderia sp. Ac-20342]|nr:ShlB/FhaC/HecB family hemolysin secretion/activation protein [Paraburkholderia sp. Ac-20342]MBN3849449.1 ShlB/FhaC/HecB family hemolysin secretion/activation protein [Paraburkholderia sp. Ac-20342]